MPWYPALDRLCDVLAELYPDMAGARRVAASASLPIEPIGLHGEPRHVWRAILEEAEKQRPGGGDHRRGQGGLSQARGPC